jgi:histidinol phosphatase-like PHP family hydrolase
MNPPFKPTPLPQDLHLHSVWSDSDSSVVPEQTIELIAAVRHARVVGISDHFEMIVDRWDDYRDAVRRAGLLVGTEVNGHEWVPAALDADCDYRVYHCWNQDADYRALEDLLAADQPVIVAHPHALETDLDRVPPEAIVEINNRYIWRCDWHAEYGPYVDRFRFVISSDAHQPNWLNQTVARHAAAELGIRETLLFQAGAQA